MLAKRYLEKIHELLSSIGVEQLDKIATAGDIIARCLASNGAVFITEMGHGTASELTNRAGGLIALKQFTFGMHSSSPVADCRRDRPQPEPVDAEAEQVRTAIRTSQLRPGDVVLVGSVSGRNRLPIELAIQCREAGIQVIALTSLDYTTKVSSLHPSGKKLAEVADLVIDICVPYGDACLEVEGLPVKVLPLSGIGFITVLWMICASTIEKMIAMGLRPHVYMSHNSEGGPEFNERELAEYNKLGY